MLPSIPNARYFDGKTAAAQIITIAFGLSGQLSIDGNLYSREDYRISVPPGGGAIFIYLHNGASVEIPAGSLSESQRRALSGYGSSLRKFENKPTWILGVILGAAATIYAAYIWILPLATDLIAPLIPYKVKASIGSQYLEALDRLYLKDSTLGPTRQSQITNLIQDFVDNPNIRVILRGGGALGANAFALVPNYMIITDELANKLSDSELLAVVAHEYGHLQLNHSTAVIVRGSLLTVLTVMLFGGDTAALSALPVAILEASYSQSKESAADAFAAKYLLLNHMSPMELAKALNRLDESENDNELVKWLGSHPSTPRRIEALRELSKPVASPR